MPGQPLASQASAAVVRRPGEQLDLEAGAAVQRAVPLPCPPQRKGGFGGGLSRFGRSAWLCSALTSRRRVAAPYPSGHSLVHSWAVPGTGQ